MAPTIIFRPGMTATDLRALNTLNVLKAPNCPKSFCPEPKTEGLQPYRRNRRDRNPATVEGDARPLVRKLPEGEVWGAPPRGRPQPGTDRSASPTNCGFPTRALRRLFVVDPVRQAVPETPAAPIVELARRWELSADRRARTTVLRRVGQLLAGVGGYHAQFELLDHYCMIFA